MKFPDAFLDQVKASFRLSDYIGHTLQLKRQGGEYVGLSPFTKEKTPSFFVNDQKAFWCDFSSGKTGDIIDWLTGTEGLTFVEAVERLADEAGIPLPERDQRSTETDQRRQQLENVLGASQDYFMTSLRTSNQAIAYLANRGLAVPDCERFGIGFAPDIRTGLIDHLRARGLDSNTALAAGVAVLPEGQSRPYDRYRGRITFPISDVAGRPVSFGARALDPTAKAKYLNGPDTELFDKGRNLYGLDISRKLLAAGAGLLLVVEGYMDAVACLRAGIPACAPMGTSLTENQLDLLWRFHPEPTLCFDGDAAGRRAAARAMDLAVPKIGGGKSLRFSVMTGGKDPDEVLRRSGPEVLRAQLLKATPLAEAIFERERTAGPLDTPEQRAALRERLNAIVRLIRDKPLANEYRDAFRVRLEAARKRPASEMPASTASIASAQALRLSVPPRIRALAYWLLKDPARAINEIEALDEMGLGHDAVDPLVARAVTWLSVHDPNGEALTQHLHAIGLGEVVVGLCDPGHTLADPGAWLKAWRARVDYLKLEAEIRRVKTNLNGPDAMQRFLSLKAQRDQAKAAL